MLCAASQRTTRTQVCVLNEVEHPLKFRAVTVVSNTQRNASKEASLAAVPLLPNES